MKAAIAFLLALAPLWAAPAAAQSGSDGRIARLEAGAGARLRLPTFDDTPQAILFARGERIQSVAVSDPSAYVFGLSGTGDSMTLKPAGPSTLATMRVDTDRASYDFDLIPSGAAETPQVVQIVPATALAPAPQPARPTERGEYAQSGEPLLRPSSISDDGNKTYLQWLEDQSMPAVFGIGPSGNEEMVEGYMRGGTFTIDRVYDQLIFRIDNKKASAKRLNAKRRRK